VGGSHNLNKKMLGKKQISARAKIVKNFEK
jgi:hypothetical protein